MSLLQFFADHVIGCDNVDESTFTLRAALVKELCSKYRKEPVEDSVIISGELAGNGGNITFYKLRSLHSRSNKDECRNYFKASAARSTLIEPINYPNIEPYDRQSPYYLPLSSHQLNLVTTTNIYKVYTQIGNYATNTFTSFDEYYFNNYWLSLTIGLAICEDDISQFLTTLGKLLEPFGYSSEIIRSIILFEEYTRHAS